MPTTTDKALLVNASAARRLLLKAQGLLDDPDRHASPATLLALIERMGFVQIDTINVVERAHHLTLFSRLHNYEPRMLAHLLERRHSLWEHWTHDASVIPSQWYPHWKHRFERYRHRVQRHAWWKQRLGNDPERTVEMVRERIMSEGPLQSRDFEHDHANHPLPEEGWWGWKPAKAALEHLWRCGELVIVRRVNFQKVYDLAERAMPQHHALDPSAADEHARWACTAALARLGVATASEISAFFNAIDLAAARLWCEQSVRDGTLIRVNVGDVHDGKPRGGFALARMEPTLRRLARRRDDARIDDAAPLRILSPFDPVLRDRKRARRLFGFEYRFEAFTPGPKRTYGYYVLPLLQGDRLVGRIDPKFHRERGELLVNGVWWEQGIKPTKARKAALDVALQRLAQFIGAERVTMSRKPTRA